MILLCIAKNENKWFNTFTNASHNYSKNLNEINMTSVSLRQTKSFEQSSDSVTGQALRQVENNPQLKYLESKAQAYNEQQKNIDTIKGRKKFEQSLLESTSEIFKPITETQKQSTEKIEEKIQKSNIDKEEVKDALKAITQEIEKVTTTENKGAKTLAVGKDGGTEKVIERYLSSEENRDYIFGLKHVHDSVFIFGAMQLFQAVDLLKEESEIELYKDIDSNWFISVRRASTGDSLELPVTEALLALLTMDTVSTDQNANSQYKRIIKLCLGPELRELVFERGRGRPSKVEIDLINEFQKIRKFTELIMQIKILKEGYGYRDLARLPITEKIVIPSFQSDKIILPPDANQQLKRIMVNIGSLSAGNNNPDILKENSALLDELYKNKVITKQLYKTLLYKTKFLLDTNLK
jgi:hypothetical protein